MAAKMKCLNVAFEDGELQEGLVYYGETILASLTQPILSSGTHKKTFQATSVAAQGVEEWSQSTTAMEVDSDKSIDEPHLEDDQYLNRRRGNQQGEKIIPTSNPRPIDAIPSPLTFFFPQATAELAQSEPEDISFPTKMECCFVRNPFASPQHIKVSTSEDILQCPFSSTVCTQRELPHGDGSLKTVTGKLIYSGFWCKGKRHWTGEGHIITLQCNNSIASQGGYYTGGWENNMRHGIGKMTFVSGAVYKGQWKYDKMTGFGTLKSPNGTIRGGRWNEGSLVNFGHQNQGQVSSFGIDKDTSEKLSQTQLIVENLHLKMELYKVQTKEDGRDKEYQAALYQMHQSFNAQWEQKCKEYDEKIQKAEECSLERANKVCTLEKELNKVLTEKIELDKGYHAALNEMHQRYSAQWMQKFKESKESAEKLQKCEESALEKGNRLYQLQRELDECREKQQCQICCDQPRNCITIPCNHFLYCGPCVTRHKRENGSFCPACRSDILDEILPIQ